LTRGWMQSDISISHMLICFSSHTKSFDYREIMAKEPWLHSTAKLNILTHVTHASHPYPSSPCMYIGCQVIIAESVVDGML
jgi:hypothetical protein